jgi:hypothetical protein
MSDNGKPPEPPPLPAMRRRNHGRGHSYYIGETKVPGVTTALGDGYPKPALVDWAARETAGYAIDHWDELAELTPSKRLAALARARFEVQQEASLRGTRVHEYAQRLAAGETVEVPDEYRDHVDAYLRFAEEWQPAELYVEAPVFSLRYGYAGTPDLIAELVDGQVWLLDWKTSSRGAYPDHVLQLAACRYGEYVLDPNLGPVPMPAVDACGIVWLRADGYDLLPVDADRRAFELFLYVKAVARFVKSDREEWIGDAVLPPARREATA